MVLHNINPTLFKCRIELLAKTSAAKISLCDILCARVCVNVCVEFGVADVIEVKSTHETIRGK